MNQFEELTRRVEVHRDAEWVRVSMKDVRSGDVFRMFEPTGSPVVDPSGRTEWEADSDAFLDEGVYCVSVK